MEMDNEAPIAVPFQLQFDKPVASQIKIAEWNPEKDLLAMVTEDSKILLHRFNWQRLWTLSLGRCITSLCWRPDGKAIAVGLEDGTISLLDVENGKLLRSIKSHTVAIVCLNWEDGGQHLSDHDLNIATYEDRTSRFFPPPPRVPRVPGLVPGEAGFMDDSEDLSRELSNYSHQRFNMLCSGHKDGIICFSIFGIFPIGKVDVHNLSISCPILGDGVTHRLLNASISKIALSKDLCNLVVLCSGEIYADMIEQGNQQELEHDFFGLHCLMLDTSVFLKRKSELHQVAQQAANIVDLTEIIRSSLSVMCKQWSDAMHTFHEKFNSLSSLIVDHGLDSTPQEEFLSLLVGARTSPPVHQFLANSLGEAGLKRIAKVVCGAGKDLQTIVLEHLQPAAEIVGFRMGELRGLSKWRARFQGIGLDERLIDDATEKACIMLIQIERFMGVLSSVVQQFSNFFNWLLKSVRMLMSEPSDQLLPFSSELVILFLKFLYNQDPIKLSLELSEADKSIEVDLETMQRVKELAQFGGLTDCQYVHRTLAKEFQQMESCFKEAFQMPFTVMSKKILCKDMLPLFPFPSSSQSTLSTVPTSISYYQEASQEVCTYQKCQHRYIDYVSFQIPGKSSSYYPNCIGIVRGLMHNSDSITRGHTSLEAIFLCVPDGYCCVDLSMYKDSQIVLLLNETSSGSESSGNACLMIIQGRGLPFATITSSPISCWKLQELKDSVVYLQMGKGKARTIPHSVVAPLAVSSSRGVACVFAARKRALVYILDEDEDEASDGE